MKRRRTPAVAFESKILFFPRHFPFTFFRDVVVDDDDDNVLLLFVWYYYSVSFSFRQRHEKLSQGENQRMRLLNSPLFVFATNSHYYVV